MRFATLCHTGMAGELAAFRTVVLFAMELVLGHSPSNTAREAVVGDLPAKF
jgi:hypothetical protein